MMQRLHVTSHATFCLSMPQDHDVLADSVAFQGLMSLAGIWEGGATEGDGPALSTSHPPGMTAGRSLQQQLAAQGVQPLQAQEQQGC